MEYQDLFGNPHQQKAAVDSFTKLLKVRDRLLEDNRVETTLASGASLDTASPACQGGGGVMHS